MDFKDLYEQAKKSKLDIDKGFRKLAQTVAEAKKHLNKDGLNKEDYDIMMQEFERVKELKKEIDERYS